jgi:rRNA processing protein Krr1/Pno1
MLRFSLNHYCDFLKGMKALADLLKKKQEHIILNNLSEEIYVILEKQEIRTKLVTDHPEMSPEKVEEHVGIIFEARRAVLALIAKGVPPDVAPKLVTHALQLNETDRGRLHNLAASHAERQRESTAADVTVSVAPPMDAIPARNPVADPMSGEI